MKNSVSQRIKMKKSGKILRRAMTLGHSRGNKSTTQMQRKARFRSLDVNIKKLRGYF